MRRRVGRVHMEKEISVIIPCYNAEKYLDACLESLIHQTIGIENMEIIIVDDGSLDGSAEKVLEYERRYPESILFIPLTVNEGQANARNIGIQNASAEYITFLDADDWIEYDIYERMLAPAHEYVCDYVQCKTVEHIEGLSPNYPASDKEQGFYDLSTLEKKKVFFKKYAFNSLLGSLLRRKWVLENELFFRHFKKYEDNYFGGIMKYEVNSYYLLDEYMYHYRILPVSNSHVRNDNNHFERLNVSLELLKYYQKKQLMEIYYEEIRKDFLQGFFVNTLHIICCQFDEIPLEIIRVMQETVKEVFPDYLEYVREEGIYANPVLLVAFDFPLEMWEQYKRAYLAWVKERNEDLIVGFYYKCRSALHL